MVRGACCRTGGETKANRPLLERLLGFEEGTSNDKSRSEECRKRGFGKGTPLPYFQKGGRKRGSALGKRDLSPYREVAGGGGGLSGGKLHKREKVRGIHEGVLFINPETVSHDIKRETGVFEERLREPVRTCAQPMRGLEWMRKQENDTASRSGSGLLPGNHEKGGGGVGRESWMKDKKDKKSKPTSKRGCSSCGD